MNRKRRLWLSVVIVLCLAGRGYAAGTVERGMLFHAPFDGTSRPAIGSPAADAQGLTWVAGHKDAAVFFGPDASLAYPTAGNFNPAAGTLEFWLFWPRERSHIAGSLFSVGALDKPNSFLAWNDGDIIFRIYDEQAKPHNVYVPVAGWQPGQWHHLAFTWNNINSVEKSGFAIYLDGVRLADKAEKIAVAEIPPEIKVGNAGLVLDDLKIYDYAKTPFQIWTEIRSQTVQRVFKDTGGDRVISRRDVVSPIMDMGSYVLAGTWYFNINYRGCRLLDGPGWIGLGKDVAGKPINSNVFRKKVEVVEFEDGHAEINWSDRMPEIGLELQSRMELRKDRFRYAIAYSFSRDWAGGLGMFPTLGGVLGAKYKATDIEGNVTEGVFPEAFTGRYLTIPKNPLGVIEVNKEGLGRVTLRIETEDYAVKDANRINITPDSVRVNFSQDSGNSAGYSNKAALEMVLE